MADSLITKKALAETFRGLLSEKPFSKITVSEICERCGINRKSFYYHFSDKYAMVNWIFDYEFANPASQDKAGSDAREKLLYLCTYFYKNRYYYKKLFDIEDYNSFSNHFRKYITPNIERSFNSRLDDKIDNFTVEFFADAVVFSIKRWIKDPDCQTPEEFVAKTSSLISIYTKALNDKAFT